MCGESSEHIRGKEILAEAFEFLGLKKIAFEKLNPLPLSSNAMMLIPFQYDVAGVYDPKTIIAGEVDGKVGHTTTQAHYQDIARDRAGLAAKVKVITVRFPTGWLVGPRALPKRVIVEQIIFECEQYGVHINAKS